MLRIEQMYLYNVHGKKEKWPYLIWKRFVHRFEPIHYIMRRILYVELSVLYEAIISVCPVVATSQNASLHFNFNNIVALLGSGRHFEIIHMHTHTQQRWLAFHALALLNYLFIPKLTLVLLGYCLLPCTVLNSYVYCKCPTHSTTIAYCDVFTINFQTNCSAFDCCFHHIVCLRLLLFHPKNSKQSKAEQIKSNSLISKNKLFSQ